MVTSKKLNSVVAFRDHKSDLGLLKRQTYVESAGSPLLFLLYFLQVYMTKFIYGNQELVKELKEFVMNTISDLSDYVKEKKDHVKDNHKYLLDDMQSIKFTALQNAFDKSLKDQANFYRIYLKLLEAILLFIRATVEQSRELHLHSLDSYTRISRMMPVYLSQMLEPRENDERTENI